MFPGFFLIGLIIMKIINYNSEFYSLKNILAAAKAYQELADITVSEYTEGFTVTFHNCRYDETRTVHEFDNYVISLMNQTNEHL